MHEYKEQYILDFSNAKDYYDIFSCIKEYLDFPDYFGINWDAVWDCLTCKIGDRINIRIIGFDNLINFPSHNNATLD